MKRIVYLFAFIFVLSLSIDAQLSADAAARIDKAAADTLVRTGVPSASVAVVKDGKIVYVKAYGDATLDPKRAAASSMRYSIGSISKQFTGRCPADAAGTRQAVAR
jgi:CubicO group peptidase (beta-lactamase class C family)